MELEMKRLVFRLLTVFALVAALLVTTFLWQESLFDFNKIQQFSESTVFKRDTTGPAFGELGGHAVSIRRPYADFLEYDGDPHWLERRRGPQPERTFASKISSFGFYIRYPEMEVLLDKSRQEKDKESIYTSNWLLVGVHSNSSYGSTGDTALEAYIQKIPMEKGFPYRYEKLPVTIYGLTGYTPIGVDESLRDRPNGTDFNDRNIYFHRDAEGKANTYIECNNSKHAAAPCSLKFNLLPQLRAHVSVSFRKGLLPYWHEIQSSVSQIILGFRVKSASKNAIQK